MSTDTPIHDLVDGLAAGNRRSLSYALSLVESTAPEDAPRIAELLRRMPKPPIPSRRIGVTGAPGVGKSTLLETMGLEMVGRGRTVAVLAVDPSSRRTGGSILGDKVRMQQLALHDKAFVRPSPSRLALGGATNTMRDAIAVCEAAGFDTIIVETVGVGQSEIDVVDMVDLFVLLVLPHAGDDIQGIKRGIMEVADAIVVTKADISAESTSQAVALYRAALRLMLPSRPAWQSAVVSVSAMEHQGINALLEVVDDFFAEERRAVIDEQRQSQRMSWFEESIRRKITMLAEEEVSLSTRLMELRHRVRTEDIPVTSAVQDFVTHLTISFTEHP